MVPMAPSSTRMRVASSLSSCARRAMRDSFSEAATGPIPQQKVLISSEFTQKRGKFLVLRGRGAARQAMSAVNFMGGTGKLAFVAKGLLYFRLPHSKSTQHDW